MASVDKSCIGVFYADFLGEKIKQDGVGTAETYLICWGRSGV